MEALERKLREDDHRSAMRGRIVDRAQASLNVLGFVEGSRLLDEGDFHAAILSRRHLTATVAAARRVRRDHDPVRRPPAVGLCKADLGLAAAMRRQLGGRQRLRSKPDDRIRSDNECDVCVGRGLQDQAARGRLEALDRTNERRFRRRDGLMVLRDGDVGCAGEDRRDQPDE